MQLNKKLFEAVASRAGQTKVNQVCLGIGYTAVTLDDGGAGIAYTYFDRKTGCSLMRDYEDFEGRPATDLLALIQSSNFLQRTMALALINALNHAQVRDATPDHDNAILLEALGIGPQSKVAMVGYIKPLARMLESRGTKVEVIDEFRQIGTTPGFYDKLAHWADAALITSTSILNNTLEDILGHLGPGVKAGLVGPSTPMVTSAFSAWPAVRALAGSVPLDAEAVLKTVRHGLGTPYLHRYCNKVTLTVQP
jgi:uncharacterized protein (DUF4213/DUF364 family)